MRFQVSQVGQQVQLMVAKLFREKHVDIPMAHRGKVTKAIERIIISYTNDLGALEEEAKQLMADNEIDNDPRAFWNAMDMLATKRDFPMHDEALRFLNREIRSYLWDSDDIEEIYSDDDELNALLQPFLIAMRRP